MMQDPGYVVSDPMAMQAFQWEHATFGASLWLLWRRDGSGPIALVVVAWGRTGATSVGFRATRAQGTETLHDGLENPSRSMGTPSLRV